MEANFWKFEHSYPFPGITWCPTKNLGLIGSAVLTYWIQTDRQAKFIYRLSKKLYFIHIFHDISRLTRRIYNWLKLQPVLLPARWILIYKYYFSGLFAPVFNFNLKLWLHPRASNLCTLWNHNKKGCRFDSIFWWIEIFLQNYQNFR